MEFLGDAVLDLVIGHLIMDRYPDYPEGSLSRLRASVVNENRLAKIARDLSLGEYLLLGKGEEMTRGREKSSILSSSLEALLAAIYLDGGFKKAFRAIAQLFSLTLEVAEKRVSTRITSQLQELSGYQGNPRYVLAKEYGPDHARCWRPSSNSVSPGGRKRKKERNSGRPGGPRKLYLSLKEK
jgi:dsRNA-specific ribonuclease